MRAGWTAISSTGSNNGPGHSQLYHGHIQLADTDSQRYESLEFSTPQHPSEKSERLILRLLAYTLLYEPGMAFRKGGLSEGNAPDVAVRDIDDRILHWIDVGTPTLDRLQKAARHTPRVSLVTHEHLLQRWKRQHDGQLPDFSGRIVSLDSELVETLAATLTRRFEWQATLSGGVLRCQPWRAKRRLVDPSSRETALLTRRAHSARGEAK
ncbi:YaeQ family protein [Thiolapillus sp.]|uniref:YaeQ family protein n=4 Tax=Thiolapillus sp. TaxID=2017437 RepID=UPI0025E24885|nr:YaeQ family protein [Thiolapillus sp.]